MPSAAFKKVRRAQENAVLKLARRPVAILTFHKTITYQQMAPVHTDDYYAILEISQIADVACIRTSYRRLARIKHPDKVTKDKVKATTEFQCVISA